MTLRDVIEAPASELSDRLLRATWHAVQVKEVVTAREFGQFMGRYKPVTTLISHHLDPGHTDFMPNPESDKARERMFARKAEEAAAARADYDRRVGRDLIERLRGLNLPSASEEEVISHPLGVRPFLVRRRRRCPPPPRRPHASPSLPNLAGDRLFDPFQQSPL